MTTSAQPSKFASRLRAAWRVFLFFLILFVALFITTSLENFIERALLAAGYRPVLMEWAMPLGALIATAICIKWVDGKSWDYVWLGRASVKPKLLAQSALLGAAAQAATAAEGGPWRATSPRVRFRETSQRLELAIPRGRARGATSRAIPIEPGQTYLASTRLDLDCGLC